MFKILNELPPAGVELSPDVMAVSGDSAKSAAPALQFGEFRPDLERLVELWPMLSADDRAALLAHAEQMVGLQGNVVDDGLAGLL